MSKRLKELIVDELQREFGDVEEAVIIGCAGLNAEQTGEFRSALRESGATVSVVKNTLAQRVFSSRGMEFGEDCFTGVTAIIHGNDDAIGASKLVTEWRKKNKKDIPLKGGILAGEAVQDGEGLADLPSVEEVKQMVVSAIAGPLTSLVGITQNVLTGVPGVLQAIADKEGEGE